MPHHTFLIIDASKSTNNSIIVGQIVLYKEPQTVAARNLTRSKTALVEQDTITIHWININKDYTGQGLATALMIYGICKMILHMFFLKIPVITQKSYKIIYIIHLEQRL